MKHILRPNSRFVKFEARNESLKTSTNFSRMGPGLAIARPQQPAKAPLPGLRQEGQMPCSCQGWGCRAELELNDARHLQMSAKCSRFDYSLLSLVPGSFFVEERPWGQDFHWSRTSGDSPRCGKIATFRLELSPIYTSNFYMALFMWQFLFARVDDEK